MEPPQAGEEEVQGWGELREDIKHPVKVIAVRKRKKRRGQSPAVLVTVQHVDSEHAGRESQVALPLPLRPDNLTTRFFRALGLATDVGCRVKPRDAVGHRLFIVFGPSDDGQDASPIAFHPIKEPEHAEHAG